MPDSTPFTSSEETKPATRSPWLIWIVKLLLPILIIGAGMMFARYLYATKPTAKRARPKTDAPLVSTIKPVIGPHPVVISSMGTIAASTQINLRSRVSGLVLTVSDKFMPGGLFKTGEVILSLDPEDYELALTRQETLLAKAQAELNLEMGKQDVAKQELKLMQDTWGKPLDNTDLALRKPQLEQVKSDIESIKVDIRRTRLDLERTVIRAPFNCIILEKHVDKGSQVSSQDTLGILAGTDEYWVETTLPQDHLKWINYPHAGQKTASPAEILTRDGTSHPGQVIRLLGNLNPQTRLARVLVSVKNPLGIGTQTTAPPLLLGSYVTVKIKGSVIEKAIHLPRAALREGDTIWIAEDDHLSIRSVAIIWKNTETVFATGDIFPDDPVILSDLSSPVNGMALRTKSLSTDE